MVLGGLQCRSVSSREDFVPNRTIDITGKSSEWVTFNSFQHTLLPLRIQFPIIPVEFTSTTGPVLIDTGSTVSFLSDELMEEVEASNDLKHTRSIQYHGVVKTLSFHQIPRTRIRNIVIQNPVFGSTKWEDFSFSGVLGMDILKHVSLTLDLGEGRVRFDANQLKFSSTRTIDLRKAGNRMAVHVYINDRGPFRFLLDTGSEILILSESVARSMDIQAPARSADRIRSEDLIYLQNVRLASIQLGTTEAVIVPDDVVPSNFDGVLGMNALQGRTFTIQYRKDTLHVHTSK